MTVVAVSRAMFDAKPAYGSPCNGCGLCCHSQVCGLGRAVLGTEVVPCPAIVHRPDKTFGCGLVEKPELFAGDQLAVYTTETLTQAAKVLLPAGTGCDCRLSGETNPAYEAAMNQRDDFLAAARMAARNIWGMP